MVERLSYQTFDECLIPVFDHLSSTRGAIEVLAWSYSHYSADEIVYACSFGVEGMVMIDLISEVHPKAKLAFLDTGLHFNETYHLINIVKDRYPLLNIEIIQPALSLEEQAVRFENDLWNSNPDSCCEMRKVIPLRGVLSESTAWISGLRREQSEMRRSTDYINIDHNFKSVKICPLIHWSSKEIWRYVSKHQLSYNPLHDSGYLSIGCRPCTRPAINPDDTRSGRWSGTGKTECGLHR